MASHNIANIARGAEKKIKAHLKKNVLRKYLFAIIVFGTTGCVH